MSREIDPHNANREQSDDERCCYRKNVAAIVINSSGLILACERSDRKGVWQLPQGGIELGESPEQALKRELWEEIGCTSYELIASTLQPIRYDWPKDFCYQGYCGQEQLYFLVKVADDIKIELGPPDNPEFAQTRWMQVQEFLNCISGFKKDAYKKGITYFIDNYANVFK